jgi:hypothetical protein
MIDREITVRRMTQWGKVKFLVKENDIIGFDHQEARPECSVFSDWCIRIVWIVKICQGALANQTKMYQQGNGWVANFEDADAYDSELDAINTVSIIAKNDNYKGRAFQIEKVYLSKK